MGKISFDEKVEYVKLLGDETRFKILDVLMGKEMCVCEIVTAVSKSQPNVSIHLGKLEDAGIISSKREGRKILYKIVDKRVKMLLKILDKSLI